MAARDGSPCASRCAPSQRPEYAPFPALGNQSAALLATFMLLL
jgi:hypothetical protein